jgi:LCP family protein required for cell wall assembly
MNKIFLILGFIFILVFLFFLFSANTFFFISNGNSLNFNKNFTLLLLGKPGPGYRGSENTDAIAVLYYDSLKNKLFIIPISRDLIVYDERGNLQKINSLYSEKRINTLLDKVSDFTGLEVKNYLAVDLNLVLKLIDKLNGIEIYLDEPVVDAVTLYTLPLGKQKLNGYLAELVLRSRYNREGDFFRMKNQTKVIMALKEKIGDLGTAEKLSLIQFLENNKYYWQTNLDKKDIFALLFQIKDLKSLEIVPIIIDFETGLLKSNYFQINGTSGVYGIYPSEGVDNFDKIKIYLWSKIKENLK